MLDKGEKSAVIEDMIDEMREINEEGKEESVDKIERIKGGGKEEHRIAIYQFTDAESERITSSKGSPRHTQM